jgi:LmbE family N-acetylglucosaminyl deacetylase
MAGEKSVLVIGAHQDECEYCCGGLTLKLIAKGFRVVFLNTIGDMSYWNAVGSAKNKQSIRDAKASARILGAEKILLPYRTHEFAGGDFKAMRELVKVAQAVNPEIAIIHWANDKWYDHRTTAHNSFEALVQPNTFFESNFKSNLKELYAFESGAYQTFDFRPHFDVNISAKMGKITESIFRFKAMGEGIMNGLEKEKKALAHFRATEVEWGGVDYAEAYVFLKYRPKEISILPELLGDDFRMTSWPETTHQYGK